MKKKWQTLLRKMIGLFEPKIDTFKELQRFRDVENRLETICKMLKCQPDEILTKINKVQATIDKAEVANG